MHLLPFKLSFVKGHRTLRAWTTWARSFRHLEETGDARGKTEIQNSARYEGFKGKQHHLHGLSQKEHPLEGWALLPTGISHRAISAHWPSLPLRVWKQMEGGSHNWGQVNPPALSSWVLPPCGGCSNKALSESASHHIKPITFIIHHVLCLSWNLSVFQICLLKFLQLVFQTWKKIKFYKLGDFLQNKQHGLIATEAPMIWTLFLFYLNTCIDVCEGFHVPIYLVTNKIKS